MKLSELKLTEEERSVASVFADHVSLRPGGNFVVAAQGLTSLKGTPEKIPKHFWCNNNKLTNLIGGPKEVGGDYNCSDNMLITLKGAPEKIGRDFRCSGNNKLTSLVGGPKEVGGDFNCENGPLTSLKGAPEKVGGSFFCGNNDLTSLEGAPQYIGSVFNCSWNQLTSLKDIHKRIKKIGGTGGTAVFTFNPIESHVLGLLKIKTLNKVELDNKDVEKIINKYLPEGNIFDCQEELIDAGFEEFAQL